MKKTSGDETERLTTTKESTKNTKWCCSCGDHPKWTFLTVLIKAVKVLLTNLAVE